jgi:hypothetical protein
MPRILPPAPEGLTIQKAEFDHLDGLIGSIPATFSVQLVDFFRLIAQKRVLEKKKAEEEESKKDRHQQ